MDDRAFAKFLLAIAIAIILFNLASWLLILFALVMAIYTLHLARKDGG